MWNQSLRLTSPSPLLSKNFSIIFQHTPKNIAGSTSNQQLHVSKFLNFWVLGGIASGYALLGYDWASLRFNLYLPPLFSTAVSFGSQRCYLRAPNPDTSCGTAMWTLIWPRSIHWCAPWSVSWLKKQIHIQQKRIIFANDSCFVCFSFGFDSWCWKFWWSWKDDKIWLIECCCTFDEQNPGGKPLDMLNMP